MSTQEKKEPVGKTERQPHRIRLPGFIKEEKIGLGDVIKKVTYAMGIKPCAGCENARLRLTVGCVSPDNHLTKQPNPQEGEILWNNRDQMNHWKPFPLAQATCRFP